MRLKIAKMKLAVNFLHIEKKYSNASTEREVVYTIARLERVVVHYCPLERVVVHYCPHERVVVHYCPREVVHYCPRVVVLFL